MVTVINFYHLLLQLQTTVKSKSSEGSGDGTTQATTSSTLHKDYHSTPALPTEAVGTIQNENHETSRTVVERNAKNARSFAADFEFNSNSSGAFSQATDRDAKVGDMRGYFTLPGRHKKMLEDGGSYRAVTRIRPVASTMTRQLANFTSSGAPPPPDHPPPPPPQTQFVAMDYKNSDYAKVTVKSPGKCESVLKYCVSLSPCLAHPYLQT